MNRIATHLGCKPAPAKENPVILSSDRGKINPSVIVLIVIHKFPFKNSVFFYKSLTIAIKLESKALALDVAFQS